MSRTERTDQKKTKYLILLLLLITIVAIFIAVWAMFFRGDKEVLAPDYAPQEEDINAEPIPDDDDEKMDQPEGGGSVSLTYSKEVTIDLSDKKALLLFANPGKSNQDMLLQIVIQDELIAQSGALVPGKQIQTMDLTEKADKKLKAGTYEGKFIVSYYDPESSEKAIVNTEIPITISVRK